jgi:DNA-binding transcriptional LysR family regulator
MLDLQDLFIMKLFLEGGKYITIAMDIHITRGAISQRVTKLRDIYGDDIFKPRKSKPSRIELSTKGIEIFSRASNAIKAFEGSS